MALGSGAARSAMIRQLNRGLLQKTQTSKLPNLTTCARTPFWSFCAGQRRIGPGQITDGTYQQTPSAECVYFPPRCLPPFGSSVEDPNTRPTTADDTTTTTTRDTKPGSFGIARPVPRVECVGGGHGRAVVLVSRARSFVWCVTPRGARAFKTQAAAAAWWDVAWYVGRTKRHGVGFELFHDSLKHSSSTPIMAKPRGLDEKCS